MLQRIFFLFLLLVPTIVLAQDSLHQTVNVKTVITYSLENDFIYGKVPEYGIDTNIAGADKENPPLEKHYNFLGTNGSAAESQIFNPNNSLYTKTGISSYDLYLLKPEETPSYKTNKRYTEIGYHTGAFKENGITLVHSQNITRTWNAGFFFERMSVKDFMQFSNTFRSRFNIYTSYHSKDGRYSIYAGGIWNAIKNEVNGGLTSDSLFENTNVNNLGIKGLAYQIGNATQNTRTKAYFASQYFDIGKAIRDTAGNITGRNTFLRIQYRFQTEKKSYAYADTDPDTSFYQNFFYDDTITYDSLHSDEYVHRFALQKPAGAFGKSAFMRNWSQGVYAEIEQMKYSQRGDSSWENVSGGANVLWKKDSLSTSFFAEARYVFSGFDKDNFIVHARFTTKRYNFGQVTFEASSGISSPDYFYRSYDGNNFRWTNNFNEVKYLHASVTYTLKQYKILASYSHSQQDNFIYMNKSALPEQSSEQVVVDQLKIGKDFTYRNFHFDNLFVFQNIDRENIFRLPELIAENSLYYQKYYFNNALEAATGFHLTYSSSYFADAFMPATASFYLQDEKETGGYFRTDLFINAKIKTAMIYIKFENAFDGLSGTSYFLTPHYPMPGRVFRFGLRWRFFD
jgi:hypothetical protein